MTEQANNETAPAKKNLRFSFPLSLIIAIIACCLSGYAIVSLYVQNNQFKLNNAARNQSWQQFQVTHLSKSQTLEAQLGQQNSRLQTVEKEVDNLAIENNHTLATRTLSNASFLIHTAELQLAATHDLLDTIHALSLAQQIVAKANLPDLFTLQQALANDIATLKKTNASFQPNIIISQLNTIQDQITALKLYQKKNFQAQKPTPAAPTASTAPWYHRINQVLAGFKGMVIIRHHQDNVPLLLSQHQMQTIQETLSLKISLAQWAITQQDNAAFHDNLQFVQRWLKTLTTTNPEANKITTALNKIASLSITPNQPSTLTSVAVINELFTQNNTDGAHYAKKVTPPAPTQKKTSPQGSGV